MIPTPIPTSAPRPGRLRRALARVAVGLGLGTVFVGAALGGVALHLDTAPARRVARAFTNDLLGSLFQGRIVVDEIDALGLDGVRIRSAVALDPRGDQVIRASNIEARADVVDMLSGVLFGGGELRIEIPRIQIEHADVLVEASPTGGVTIGDTFSPLPPKQPRKPSQPSKGPGRPVRVAMPHITIGHGWVHGQVAPPRALDADVKRLRGSVIVGPEGVSVDIEQTGLLDRAFLPGTTAGTANYHLRAGQKLAMWAGFAGRVAAVEVLADWELTDSGMRASGSLPRVTPDELATLVPDHPLTQPVSARVQLASQGSLFEVEADVEAAPSPGQKDAPGGRVRIEARIDAAGGVPLEADVTARELDLRLFGESLPDTTLTAEARVQAGLRGPWAIVDTRTEPTTLSGQDIPAADVHLVYAGGELSGTATLHEPGMPVHGAFAVLPDRSVRFVAEADIPSIARAPRIAGPVSGSARVHVEGTARADRLDARFRGAVAGIRAADAAELGSGRVEGRVEGPLEALRVDARLTGRDLTAGGLSFESVELDARGGVKNPALRARLKDGDDTVTAAAQLSTAEKALRKVALEIRRGGQEVRGEIARIGPGRRGLSIEGARIEGDEIGAVEGGLTVQGGDVTGALRAEGIDLARLGKMLGAPIPLGGLANVDVALERDKEGRRSGKLLVELVNGEAASLTGVGAHVTATVEQDQLRADALVRLVGRGAADPRQGAPGHPDELRCNGAIATLRLSRGQGTLSGPLLRAGTWAGLSGSAEIAAEDWDLGCIAQLFPILSVWVSDVQGKLNARAEVARAPADRFPSITSFHARTRGLELAGPRGLFEERAAWESRSIDGQIKGSLDGKTGRADVALTLYDGAILTDASLSAELDLAALVDRPRDRWQTLRRAPITGRASIPRRPIASFSTLPSPLRERIPSMAGEIRLDVYADGTLAEPFLAARVGGFGLSYVGQDALDAEDYAFPLDLDALVTFDGTEANLDAHVSKGADEVAAVTASASAPDGAGWTGGFHARLNEAPIGELPLLGDKGIAGHLSGEIAVSGLGRAPTLDIELDAPDLQIGEDLFFERGAISLHIGPRRPARPGEPAPAPAPAPVPAPAGAPLAAPASADTGIARVELVTQEGGRLDATAFAGVRWKDGLIPSLDDESAADLYARASGLRLAVAQPLVAGALSRLDGYLNGELRIGWHRAGEEDAAKVEADMRVTQGVIHIPALGQELREAQVRVVAKDGTVRFDDLSAAGLTGRVRGWALARLDGLKLLDGAGAIRIAKGEEIPLTLEGVPFGMAYGDLSFTAEKRPRELAFWVRVPTLHLTLPETSRRSVQSLEEHPDIAVSHPLGPEKQLRSEDALRYSLTFTLGDVHVEGAGLDVQLSSPDAAPPRVVLADRTRVTGDIVVTRGRLEVLGKQFEIERALVRLRDEETSNPYVNATAHWDAPDGTRVYVDYVGLLKPVTDEKLRFRSNPPLPQRQILARLLFDSGAGGSDGVGGVGDVAAGVGGELASSQFNAILEGIAPLRGLSTRFGASSQGGLKTSIAYELDDNLTALASFEDAPAAGTTAGTAGTTTGTSTAAPGGAANQRSGRTELSVDWRFHRNWSLRGTVGVGGAQPNSGILDLLWQYRY